MLRRIVYAAALAALPALALAQSPVVKSQTVTKKVTITGIEPTTRMVTFKDAEGNEDTVQAGPAIARFDELKVGDTVTFKYSESLVFALKKAGDPAAPSTGELGVSGGGGKTPGGVLAAQVKTTVTVVSVDQDASTITVKTEDGRVMTRKVQEKKNLKDVKSGDQIEITYTQAWLASVDPSK
jgi:hypothetical protein